MDKLSTYVFTTRYVIHMNSVIVRVIHDDEGDWQFLGEESDLKEEDAMIISLGEILQRDNSLIDIINIPRGKIALRNGYNQAWSIYDFKYE